MVKKPGERATKAQIFEAFDELMEEKKAVETQLKQIQKEAQAKPSVAVKEKQPVVEATKVMSQTQIIENKMNYTLESLAKLQAGFGSTVSELSEKLTSEASKLQELRGFVATEIQALKELHDLEVAEGMVDTLIETYETSSKAFKQEFTERKETLEQQTQDRRKGWEKEQEEYKRTIKDRNDTQAKTRQRDVDEYKYELQLTRKLDADEYSQTQKALYKELEELRQAQEKEWTEREKAIAEREKQHEEAKIKVEAFPQEKEAAIKKAKDEGKGIGNYNAKIKSDMFAKEVEGQKRLYEQRLQSLENTIQTQESRLQNLAKQLDAAQKQVQDLAVKAIEGAANMSSLQTFKDLAMEQAKSQSKTK